MDMNDLLAQAQAMQAQLQQAQAELQATEFSGTAGGGLVSATVTGGGELVALEISPGAVDVDDLEALADLVIAAVRDASHQASVKAQSVMPNLGF
ncbi:MAG TPA: YbaB/EbfC family nucleoid-associated protein [Propionibacteriaceae bacterium]|nr:YbaB/EbfC family nucleoid-associated protein [Propionibacteriaceae bacterium]